MDAEPMVEVMEFWFRDRGNPYGWFDRWVEVRDEETGELLQSHGVCYPMLAEALDAR